MTADFMSDPFNVKHEDDDDLSYYEDDVSFGGIPRGDDNDDDGSESDSEDMKFNQRNNNSYTKRNSNTSNNNKRGRRIINDSHMDMVDNARGVNHALEMIDANVSKRTLRTIEHQMDSNPSLNTSKNNDNSNHSNKKPNLFQSLFSNKNKNNPAAEEQPKCIDDKTQQSNHSRKKKLQIKRTEMEETLMKQLYSVQEGHLNIVKDMEYKQEQREEAIKALENALALQSETLTELRSQNDTLKDELNNANKKIASLEQIIEEGEYTTVNKTYTISPPSKSKLTSTTSTSPTNTNKSKHSRSKSSSTARRKDTAADTTEERIRRRLREKSVLEKQEKKSNDSLSKLDELGKALENEESRRGKSSSRSAANKKDNLSPHRRTTTTSYSSHSRYKSKRDEVGTTPTRGYSSSHSRRTTGGKLSSSSPSLNEKKRSESPNWMESHTSSHEQIKPIKKEQRDRDAYYNKKYSRRNSTGSTASTIKTEQEESEERRSEEVSKSRRLRKSEQDESDERRSEDVSKSSRRLRKSEQDDNDERRSEERSRRLREESKHRASGRRTSKSSRPSSSSKRQ